MESKTIQATNDKTSAIGKVLYKMIDMHSSLVKSQEITEEVKQIITDIIKSEMSFLTKKIRKEYRNIEKEACAMRAQTKNFDKMLLANKSQIWGRRSDGR